MTNRINATQKSSIVETEIYYLASSLGGLPISRGGLLIPPGWLLSDGLWLGGLLCGGLLSDTRCIDVIMSIFISLFTTVEYI